MNNINIEKKNFFPTRKGGGAIAPIAPLWIRHWSGIEPATLRSTGRNLNHTTTGQPYTQSATKVPATLRSTGYAALCHFLRELNDVS